MREITASEWLDTPNDYKLMKDDCSYWMLSLTEAGTVP